MPPVVNVSRHRGACVVPAIDALTLAFGLLSGMAAKSAGNSSLGTNCQGPSVLQARNHRPELSTYSSSSVGSLNTFAVVFSTYRSDVPSTVANRNGPLVTISWAGTVETKMIPTAS